MNKNYIDPKDLRGRWFDILNALGIPSHFLRNHHGPCPMCGGKDRFRWDNKDGDGTYFCSQCGAGNGTDLAMKYFKINFIEFKDRVRPIIGETRVRPIPKKNTEAINKKMRKRAWLAAKKVTPETMAGEYLFNRLGRHYASGMLRELKDGDGVIMLAQFADTDGKLSNLHRTFITSEGKEKHSCKMMSGKTATGGAIRLRRAGELLVESHVLGVAEGIETALSASILFGLPVWATTGSSLLAKWVCPPDITKVIIFGDNDPKYGGQAAAWECAHRLAVVSKEVEVRIPPEVGDWNDVLRLKLNSENLAAVAG